MDISINASFLPHVDAEASLTFYRDVLGFDVRLDVGRDRCGGSPSAPPASPTRRSCSPPPSSTPP